MIQAVLFDLGGTLHTADSPEGRQNWFAQRLLERLRDYGITLDVQAEELASLLKQNGEIYKHHSEKTLRELPADEIWSEFYLHGLGVSREQLSPIAEELSFLYDYERMRVMRRPHLAETITGLRAMGLRLGLISNIISRSVAPHFLEEYGIADEMDCVILSSVTGIRKPDAGIFRIAEREMGLGPESLAYVGDTLSRDVLGVRNAGWRCMIQIKNPSVRHRDVAFEGTGLAPDYLIEDLAEIPALIEKENQK